MPTREQVIQKWQGLLDTKEDKQLQIPALTGDGSDATTCDVAGKPGWAWVRYNEKQDRASQVVNQVMPGAPQGVPVMIGKKYVNDRYFQILGLNMELYYEHTSPTEYVSYILAKHGETHLSSASDPAWIDAGNFLPGAVSATNPTSLFVSAGALTYEWAGEAQTFGGGVTDLTPTVPGVAGMHRYVLVMIDQQTNLLEWEEGVEAPLPVTPSIPAIPAAHIPLAIVMVANGDTEIAQTAITQYKFLFGSSAYLYWINQVAEQIDYEYDEEMTRHYVGA